MNPSPDNQRGERYLIERLRKICQPPAIAKVPFGDDMAGISPNGDLATTDMLMDGVDFDTSSQPLEQIGYKCMAVNLSDCAAMAVKPSAALVAVALPENWSTQQVETLFSGVQRCAAEFHCPVVGGDTNSWQQPLVISITVTGSPISAPIRRDQAKAGDTIYVSGPLGGSILGRHLKPVPRLHLASKLAQGYHPSAMLDISDGLAIDLDRILSASQVAAELDETLLQTIIHADAVLLAEQDGHTPLEHALHDGEDFELIVTHKELADSANELGLFPIGHVTEGSGMVRIAADGRRTPLPPGGWEHFR